MKLDRPWFIGPGAFLAGMCAAREKWDATLLMLGVLVAMVFVEHLSRQIDTKRAELRAEIARRGLKP